VSPFVTCNVPAAMGTVGHASLRWRGVRRFEVQCGAVSVFPDNCGKQKRAAGIRGCGSQSGFPSGTGVTGAGRFTQRKPKLLGDSVGALPDTGTLKTVENLIRKSHQ
jgi:hypothetical protein